MGLNVSNGKRIFLQVSDGKFVRQFKQPTERSVERINKNKQVVHEEFYDSLTAKISDISIKENEYGRFWKITLTDGDADYIIDMNYTGGYAISFLRALPNADINEVVTLTPKVYIEGEKKKSVMFINQFGKGLKHFWTKDNPGDLPEMKEIKVNGKKTWDSSDRLAFLEDFVKNQVLSKISAEKQGNAADTEIDPVEEDDSDVPF